MAAPATARRPTLRPHGYEPLRPIEGRPSTERARRFLARLSDEETPAAAALEAGDFLQAALLFAETCADRGDGALRIAVSDADTGETQCFTLSLAD